MFSQKNVDFIIHRWGSKKLLVFVVATVLVSTKIITNEQWFWLTGIYVSGQHVFDALISHKFGASPTVQSKPKENEEKE